MSGKTEYIGYDSQTSGRFLHSGGTNTCALLYIGYANGSTGTYELSNSGRLAVSALTIGYNSGSTGTVIQSGGVVAANNSVVLGDLAGSAGAYELAGGCLEVNTGHLRVGNFGFGSFTQTGGTNALNAYLMIGYDVDSEGIYTLGGGRIVFQSNSQSIYAGRAGKGTLMLGNAETGGVIESVAGATANGLCVGYFEGSAGTLRGWGAVRFGAYSFVMNNGRVFADGYGIDRSLDFTGVAGVVSNRLLNATSNGWYAVNHGRLDLPAFGVTGTRDYCWGDTPDNPDLVNCVKLSLTGSAGKLAGSLLATDRADVPAGLFKPVAVWDFSGITYTAAAVTIRYDADAAAALAVPEQSLEIFQHDGAAWRKLSTTVDAGAKTVSATLLNTISPIAVATLPAGTALMIR